MEEMESISIHGWSCKPSQIMLKPLVPQTLLGLSYTSMILHLGNEGFLKSSKLQNIAMYLIKSTCQMMVKSLCLWASSQGMESTMWGDHETISYKQCQGLGSQSMA